MIPEKREPVFKALSELGISYELYEHPPLDNIDIALKYWKDIDATHCKNLFFRNHKGNQHFLVIIKDTTPFDIHALEKLLKQGKLIFGSEKRLEKYLGVKPGSVSPFGLLNDHDKHVVVFLDEQLNRSKKISFHPNDNTASLVVAFADFIKFLNQSGNNFSTIAPSPKNE
ncbi:MAG: prolyl-tRNA editing protein [Bacteroidetes bacterium GWF2_41_31]|nr:MAG: prolyl-tRNA editing protein [Bacteroidetes bacterium GWF2_41_31]OFZ07852.1 MAG: prolyl-tRNA editing protein [Bacteroidetes bacterium RIFOXYB12_FULL_41_6]